MRAPACPAIPEPTATAGHFMTVKIDGAKLKIRDVVRVARPGPAGRFEKAALHPAAREQDRGDAGLYRSALDARRRAADVRLQHRRRPVQGSARPRRRHGRLPAQDRAGARDRRRRALRRGRHARHDAAARQRLRLELFRARASSSSSASSPSSMPACTRSSRRRARSAPPATSRRSPIWPAPSAASTRPR